MTKTLEEKLSELSEEQLARVKKRVEELMEEPKLLIFKEKHADRYFLFTTQEQLKDIAFKVFKERAEYWYAGDEEVDPDWMAIVLETHDRDKALDLLQRRSQRDYEYETFEICGFEPY